MRDLLFCWHRLRCRACCPEAAKPPLSGPCGAAHRCRVSGDHRTAAVHGPSPRLDTSCGGSTCGYLPRVPKWNSPLKRSVGHSPQGAPATGGIGRAKRAWNPSAMPTHTSRSEARGRAQPGCAAPCDQVPLCPFSSLADPSLFQRRSVSGGLKHQGKRPHTFDPCGGLSLPAGRTGRLVSPGHTLARRTVCSACLIQAHGWAVGPPARHERSSVRSALLVLLLLWCSLSAAR